MLEDVLKLGMNVIDKIHRFRRVIYTVLFFVFLYGIKVWFFTSEYEVIMKPVISMKKKNTSTRKFDGFIEPNMPDEDDNSSTLLGIDSNSNGIRDDIEIWINSVAQNYNERMALRQSAADLQYLLDVSSVNNKDVIVHAMNVEFTSGKCLLFIFGYDDQVKLKEKLRALTFNTELREETLKNTRDFSYSVDSIIENMRSEIYDKACNFKIENKDILMKKNF